MSAKVEKTDELSDARRSKYKVKVKKLYFALGFLFVLLAAGGYLGYSKYDKLQDENKKLSDPQEAARQETQKIKERVAKLIDVPQNEDPTIASVVDSSKLKNQAFFAKAENGDKVLMYSQAKKAILYRPSTDKIIEVAPINIGNNADSSSKSKQPAGTQATQ